MTAERTVAFFETQAQLDVLLRLHEEMGAKLVLVALTPEADYAAERGGIDFRTIEDFYSESELIEKGIQNYERVGKFCDAFDNRIKERLRSHSLCNNFSTHYWFYHLKILFDVILQRVFTLRSAIDALKPDEIICFASTNETIQDDLFFRQESVASRVIPLIARRLGYQFVQLRVDQLVSWGPVRNLLLRGARRVKRSFSLIMTSIGSNDGPILIVMNLYSDGKPIVDCWIRENAGRVLYLRQLLQIARSLQFRGVGGAQVSLQYELANLWQEGMQK